MTAVDDDVLLDRDDERDERDEPESDYDGLEELVKPLPPRWRGIMAPLDTPSGDGRVIGTPHSGKLRVRPLPMPLLYQTMTDDGHKRSVIVGNVDKVWRDGSYLMGSGAFDLGSPHGQEAARQLRDGFHRWVSVLIDDETGEPACVNADGTYTTACAEETCTHSNFFKVATDWRATSLTMVAEQAFPEATIRPMWDEEDELGDVPVEELIASGISADERKKAEDDGAAMKGGRYPVRNRADLEKAIHAVGRAGGPGGSEADRAAVRRHIIKRARALNASDMIPDTWEEDGSLKTAHGLEGVNEGGVEEDDCPCLPHAMVASTVPEAPPAAWFANPKLERPTPLTVTSDGRVFGHLACWDTCHTGYANRCVTPPRNRSGYAYFHTASIPVDDGSGTRPGLPVGLITLNTGHADIGDNHVRAMAHYDNTGAQAAAVRAGEDEFGIWLAGSVLPSVSPQERETLARSPLSGDWRVIGGQQELVAALSVNVGGFPIPRYRTDADGNAYALVAAGALRRDEPRKMSVQDAMAMVTPRDLAKLVAEELALQQARNLVAAAYRDRIDEHVQARRKAQAAAAYAAVHDDDDLVLGPEFNWVEERGGLPPYIKRIAKHVPGSESQKIATAINAAKKMCATGDVNWPGKQQVNAGSRAEACAAVARWEAMKGSK